MKNTGSLRFAGRFLGHGTPRPLDQPETWDPEYFRPDADPSAIRRNGALPDLDFAKTTPSPSPLI